MKVTGRKDTFLEILKELVIIILEYHGMSPSPVAQECQPLRGKVRWAEPLDCGNTGGQKQQGQKVKLQTVPPGGQKRDEGHCHVR
jgi:hypothetical protein